MSLVFDALYLVAAVVLGPFYLIYRLIKRKPTAPWRSRLFHFPAPRTSAQVVWIHGVSVGEILAARGLVASIRRDWPECEVVISCTTPTGHATAEREYPDCVCFYCPLDFGFSVRRALNALNPSLFVLMELELWPNLLLALEKRQIPVVLVNGRISARSASGYRRLQMIHPGLLRPIAHFMMQSEEHVGRLRGLGVEDARIEVSGNLKVDNLTTGEPCSQGLAADLGLESSLVVVAGSTHAGEDETVMRAYLRVRRDLEGLRLVLCPRHLERVEGIVSLAQSLGLPVAQRTDPRAAENKKSVLLVDTLGELVQFFDLADVVFLGGSLVEVGGHNVLEPAACGKVQLLGPHTWTVAGFVDELVARGAAVVVKDENALAAALKALLVDDARRKEAGRAAREIVVRHRGALERTMKALGAYRPSTT